MVKHGAYSMTENRVLVCLRQTPAAEQENVTVADQDDVTVANQENVTVSDQENVTVSDQDDVTFLDRVRGARAKLSDSDCHCCCRWHCDAVHGCLRFEQVASTRIKSITSRQKQSSLGMMVSLC
jgi:molybdopterin converting factor small subunit